VSFTADGFAVLPRLLSAAEVDVARRLIRGLRAIRTAGVCERPNNVLVPLRWDDGVVRMLLDRAACRQRIARACGGDDLRFTSAYLSLKEPGSGPLWWHQDWWCWEHPVTWDEAAPQVALVVFLDTTTATSGALRVLPGSHRASTDLHTVLPAVHAAPTLPERDHPAFADRPEQATIEACAGDAVLLDYRVLHGTHPHDGHAVRRGLILNFAPSWRALPAEIRAHLIAGSALPARSASVPASLTDVLPTFAGEQRDLVLSRDAPACFSRHEREPMPGRFGRSG
jgi:hypothetical protein